MNYVLSLTPDQAEAVMTIIENFIHTQKDQFPRLCEDGKAVRDALTRSIAAVPDPERIRKVQTFKFPRKPIFTKQVAEMSEHTRAMFVQHCYEQYALAGEIYADTRTNTNRMETLWYNRLLILFNNDRQHLTRWLMMKAGNTLSC